MEKLMADIAVSSGEKAPPTVEGMAAHNAPAATAKGSDVDAGSVRTP